MASIVAFAALTLRLRKNANGTSGASARVSITTNAARSATAAASTPIVWSDPQPTVLARTSA